MTPDLPFEVGRPTGLEDRRLTMEEHAAIFDAENPEVFERLRELSLQLHARGRRHYSMDALFHVLRWHRALETTDPDYKLNDHYTAYYARKLMAAERRLSGFFELRTSRFDEPEAQP